MSASHRYRSRLVWSSAESGPTRSYESYSRNHRLETDGKPPLLLSSDPAFRGDPARHNPEELLLGALASCHMLWYLHLAAANGIDVRAYRDEAEGVMEMDADGGGHFAEVTLCPEVTIAKGGDPVLAERLHADAARLCFIARSVNFPVRHRPRIAIAQ